MIDKQNGKEIAFMGIYSNDVVIMVYKPYSWSSFFKIAKQVARYDKSKGSLYCFEGDKERFIRTCGREEA